MRAILIDPSELAVIEIEMDMSLASLQAAVGGDLEFAHEFSNGDILYVDEEGLLKAQDAMVGLEESDRAFYFEIGAHQPFAGRGLIVGKEDSSGHHGSAVMTLEDVAKRIGFLVPSLMVDTPNDTMH